MESYATIAVEFEMDDVAFFVIQEICGHDIRFTKRLDDWFRPEKVNKAFDHFVHSTVIEDGAVDPEEWAEQVAKMYVEECVTFLDPS